MDRIILFKIMNLFIRFQILVVVISIQALNAEEFRDISLNKTIDEVEPLKGIVFWSTHGQINTYKNSIALEFSYCLYSDIVGSTQGVYDWTKLETLLDDIAGRGHQAVIRFRYEYPNSKAVDGVTRGMTAVPAYIKELQDYNETYSENPGGDGPTFYADWSNEELKRFTKEFYTKFAERYDCDRRIAFIQTGFGHWSEYHIYGTILDPGKNFPDPIYQKEFLQHMSEIFMHTPWSISIDAASSTYAPIVKDASLMSLRFGLFDDSFMHEEHDINQGDGYNEKCWNALNRERWKDAPAGGEFSYYKDSDQKNALNPAGMYGGTWEERASQYHMTYVIGNDVTAGAYGTISRVKEASMVAGYKFEVTRYQVSNTLAKVAIKNIGIAPLYHDAYVTVKGIRSAQSLKGLLPDQTQEYIVNVAVDNNENPEPVIASDKILSGKTIPYQADPDISTGIDKPIGRENSNIKQKNNTLTFSGENYIVYIYSSFGRRIVSTRGNRLNISSYPRGCYIVQYVDSNGKTETKKVMK